MDAKRAILSGPVGVRLYGGTNAPGSGGTLTGLFLAAAEAVASGAMGSAAPPPAPSPPPSGTIVSTGVTSAVGGAATEFEFGQVFVQGHLPTGTNLAGVQTDVLTRWPDNSAQFARISGTVSATAGTAAAVNLAAGTAIGGSTLTTTQLKAALSSPVTVTFGAFGSAAFSGTDFDAPIEVVATGPGSSKWVFRKAIGSDAHLTARLTLTLWASGNVSCKARIENCTMAVASPASKSAIATLTMGGVLKYTSTTAIDIPHHGWIDLLNATETSHWLTTQHHNKYKHDQDYLQQTGMVPAYMAKTPASAGSITGLPSTYVPLAQGSYPTGMGGGGYSNSIGLIPEWDVVHLTGEGADTYRQVLWMASNAGRYGLGYRDEAASGAEQHQPALVKNYAQLTIKLPTSSTHPGWTVPPQTSGTDPISWAPSHHPSVGFLAYLLTADPFHRDTVQFANAYNSLFEPYTQRDGVAGVFKTTTAGATRHVAWNLRTLGQAIAATPDAHTAIKAALRDQYEANIDYYWGRYINQAHNPFGFVTPYSDYSNRTPVAAAGATTTVIPCQAGQLGGAPYTLAQDGQYVGMTLTIGAETRTISAYDADTETLTVSTPFSTAPTNGTNMLVNDDLCFDGPWMTDFLNASLGYAKDLALQLDATHTARFEAFYQWKTRSTIGRMGGAGADEFSVRNYAQYTIAVAPFDSPGAIPGNDSRWNTGTGPWFANWGEVWAATFSGVNDANADRYAPYGDPGPKGDGSLRNNLSPEFPAAEALPALMYAVKHGHTGAQDALTRLCSASNWPAFTAALDLQPVWAGWWHATPKALRGQAINEWRSIPGTTVLALLPTNTAWNIAQPTTATDGAIAAHTLQRTNGANLHANRVSYGAVAPDTRRSCLYTSASGGHGDFWQNEVTELDLLSDTPGWVMVHAGSNGDVVYMSEPVGGWGTIDQRRYATDLNGQALPCARHTYGQTQFIERHGRLVTTGGSISPNGSGFQDIEAYDVEVRDGSDGWDPVGTYPGAQGGTSGGTSTGGSAVIAATCVKDPRTEIIYTFSSNTMHKVTPSLTGPTGAAGSGGTHSTSALSWNDAYPWSNGAAAVDTNRGKILWTHGYGDDAATRPYTYDIATDSLDARHTYSGAAAAALAAVPPSCGVIFPPRLDRYLLRSGAAGGGVFSIHPTTFEVTALTTTGGSGVPAQTGSGNSGPGVFTNWAFLPALRSAVYQAGAEHDLRVLRLY
ncbi:MAG: hypothetical protein Q8R98_03625 [Rubrivivax sp.]|nr:hypothetical protein [Rubrivivax sp.]MDP3610917.1 hypothetical protein [Rubrivivax sp.]